MTAGGYVLHLGNKRTNKFLLAAYETCPTSLMVWEEIYTAIIRTINKLLQLSTTISYKVVTTPPQLV